jgi:hypothetical protein
MSDVVCEMWDVWGCEKGSGGCEKGCAVSPPPQKKGSRAKCEREVERASFASERHVPSATRYMNAFQESWLLLAIILSKKN